MKLGKFADLYSKQLGNHFKIMKKYLEITQKPGIIMEKSWNFVSPEKWEPWFIDEAFFIT